jgi:hypothetical protein
MINLIHTSSVLLRPAHQMDTLDGKETISVCPILKLHKFRNFDFYKLKYESYNVPL